MIRLLIAISFIVLGHVETRDWADASRVFVRARLSENTRVFESIHSRISPGQATVQYAAPGDIATGRLLREESKELDLDTSPCGGNRVVRFHDPYEKNVIGKLKCGDATYDRLQVRQK
jgi:hypothetical protein